MDTQKKAGMILGAIVGVLAALIAFSGSPKGMTPKQGGQQSISTASPSLSSDPGKNYTFAQIAAHNSQTSCWTAINGGVYDLTSWIGKHPGGEGAILSICGTDGSDAFNAQHGGQRRPEAELSTFKIGTFIQ